MLNVISKDSRTSEKQNMLDIAEARQAYHDEIISDIFFARSNNNLAEGLTKPISQAAVRDAVCDSYLNVYISQLIAISKQDF